MSHTPSRRRFLHLTVMAGGAAALAPWLHSQAQDMPMLAEDDPTAQALSYHHDASAMDASKFPQRASTAFCHNCALYTGAEGSDAGPCSIFAGKLVNAKGWCAAWAPKA